jgi:3-hydroxyisobutyrate dehydrogenase
MRVGVIGVGNMGAPMAARLCERGFAVAVRDLRPEAEAPLGATVARSAAELAAAVDALCVVVVDAAQIEAALFTEPQAAHTALRAGQTVLLHSTIAPQEAAAIAQRLAALGVQVLDAPISGGPARARAGTLSIMAAGDEAAYAWAQPVLAALGDRVFHVGAVPGRGAAMKLVNNLLAGVNLAAAAQAFALGARGARSAHDAGRRQRQLRCELDRRRPRRPRGGRRLRSARAYEDPRQGHATGPGTRAATRRAGAARR